MIGIKNVIAIVCGGGPAPGINSVISGVVNEAHRQGWDVLGIYDGMEFTENKIQLQPGETMLMFTDGVNEAANAQYEEFGMERLTEILHGAAAGSCQQMIDSVKAALTSFAAGAEQSDDITMLAVKRT